MLLPFDSVRVEDDRGTRRVSATEFLELPLNDRLTALLQKRVAFYRGSQPVDLREALKAMRERQA